MARDIASRTSLRSAAATLPIAAPAAQVTQAHRRMATGPDGLRQDVLRPARFGLPATVRTATVRPARFGLPATVRTATGRIATGLPVTHGPGSPADGPEHGPPACGCQHAAAGRAQDSCRVRRAGPWLATPSFCGPGSR